jgi:cell division GTPase FtsZ
MRVLAIGLGGAGSRIIDQLYEHDCRSRVCCMRALAVDLDPNSLQQLRYLPGESRMFFPPIDPNFPFDVEHAIHIEEVMTRIQQIDTIQIDAILLCCGLGGTLVNAAPRMIRELRKSFVEPIFAVASIPARNEGKKRSAKAYADLVMLREIVDSLILFDNELLLKKVEIAPEERRSSLPLRPENPRDVYQAMNERIARYIGLLLRAGEFNEHGLEVAEVVLDSGEVLKTLSHMGIVSVGYAVEELPPQGVASLIQRWHSKHPNLENAHTRAARIVSLAKRAVYEESSISCDLTSAEKALVLIAGPSHELSMRGFQTVRKWIDRSISGIEMRTGDYPVRNTRFIGIIVVLAGLHNVPRIDELQELHNQCLAEGQARTESSVALSSPVPEIPPSISTEIKPPIKRRTRRKGGESDSTAGDLDQPPKKRKPRLRSRSREKDEDFGLTWFR